VIKFITFHDKRSLYNEEYETILENCRYTNISFYPSLMGEVDPEQKDLLAILSNKQSE